LHLGFLLRPLDMVHRLFIDCAAFGILDFLRRSPTLRTVKFRTSLHDCREEIILARYAVMAVAENRHGPITLHLDEVEMPPDSISDALRATKSMEELVIWLDDGSSPDQDPVPLEIEEKQRAAGRDLMAQAFQDNCSLKRLQILEDSDPQSVAALVDALRQNGGLISVEYPDFTDTQRRRAQMYCTRNQYISHIMAELMECDDTERSRRNADWLPIVPALFAVVQHSPRMAAWRIYQALIGLANDLGPTSTSRMKRTGTQLARDE
jgi:hypothetical protein